MSISQKEFAILAKILQCTFEKNVDCLNVIPLSTLLNELDDLRDNNPSECSEYMYSKITQTLMRADRIPGQDWVDKLLNNFTISSDETYEKLCSLRSVQAKTQKKLSSTILAQPKVTSYKSFYKNPFMSDVMSSESGKQRFFHALLEELPTKDKECVEKSIEIKQQKQKEEEEMKKNIDKDDDIQDIVRTKVPKPILTQTEKVEKMEKVKKVEKIKKVGKVEKLEKEIELLTTRDAILEKNIDAMRKFKIFSAWKQISIKHHQNNHANSLPILKKKKKKLLTSLFKYMKKYCTERKKRQMFKEACSEYLKQKNYKNVFTALKMHQSKSHEKAAKSLVVSHMQKKIIFKKIKKFTAARNRQKTRHLASEYMYEKSLRSKAFYSWVRQLVNSAKNIRLKADSYEIYEKKLLKRMFTAFQIGIQQNLDLQQKKNQLENKILAKKKKETLTSFIASIQEFLYLKEASNQITTKLRTKYLLNFIENGRGCVTKYINNENKMNEAAIYYIRRTQFRVFEKMSQANTNACYQEQEAITRYYKVLLIKGFMGFIHNHAKIYQLASKFSDKNLYWTTLLFESAPCLNHSINQSNNSFRSSRESSIHSHKSINEMPLKADAQYRAARYIMSVFFKELNKQRIKKKKFVLKRCCKVMLKSFKALKMRTIKKGLAKFIVNKHRSKRNKKTLTNCVKMWRGWKIFMKNMNNKKKKIQEKVSGNLINNYFCLFVNSYNTKIEYRLLEEKAFRFLYEKLCHKAFQVLAMQHSGNQMLRRSKLAAVKLANKKNVSKSFMGWKRFACTTKILQSYLVIKRHNLTKSFIKLYFPIFFAAIKKKILLNSKYLRGSKVYRLRGTKKLFQCLRMYCQRKSQSRNLRKALAMRWEQKIVKKYSVVLFRSIKKNFHQKKKDLANIKNIKIFSKKRIFSLWHDLLTKRLNTRYFVYKFDKLVKKNFIRKLKQKAGAHRRRILYMMDQRDYNTKHIFFKELSRFVQKRIKVNALGFQLQEQNYYKNNLKKPFSFWRAKYLLLQKSYAMFFRSLHCIKIEKLKKSFFGLKKYHCHKTADQKFKARRSTKIVKNCFFVLKNTSIKAKAKKDIESYIQAHKKKKLLKLFLLKWEIRKEQRDKDKMARQLIIKKITHKFLKLFVEEFNIQTGKQIRIKPFKHLIRNTQTDLSNALSSPHNKRESHQIFAAFNNVYRSILVQQFFSCCKVMARIVKKRKKAQEIIEKQYIAKLLSQHLVIMIEKSAWRRNLFSLVGVINSITNKKNLFWSFSRIAQENSRVALNERVATEYRKKDVKHIKMVVIKVFQAFREERKMAQKKEELAEAKRQITLALKFVNILTIHNKKQKIKKNLYSKASFHYMAKVWNKYFQLLKLHTLIKKGMKEKMKEIVLSRARAELQRFVENGYHIIHQQIQKQENLLIFQGKTVFKAFEKLKMYSLCRKKKKNDIKEVDKYFTLCLAKKGFDILSYFVYVKKQRRSEKEEIVESVQNKRALVAMGQFFYLLQDQANERNNITLKAKSVIYSLKLKKILIEWRKICWKKLDKQNNISQFIVKKRNFRLVKCFGYWKMASNVPKFGEILYKIFRKSGLKYSFAKINRTKYVSLLDTKITKSNRTKLIQKAFSGLQFYFLKKKQLSVGEVYIKKLLLKKSFERFKNVAYQFCICRQLNSRQQSEMKFKAFFSLQKYYVLSKKYKCVYDAHIEKLKYCLLNKWRGLSMLQNRLKNFNYGLEKVQLIFNLKKGEALKTLQRESAIIQYLAHKNKAQGQSILAKAFENLKNIWKFSKFCKLLSKHNDHNKKKEAFLVLQNHCNLTLKVLFLEYVISNTWSKSIKKTYFAIFKQYHEYMARVEYAGSKIEKKIKNYQTNLIFNNLINHCNECIEMEHGNELVAASNYENRLISKSLLGLYLNFRSESEIKEEAVIMSLQKIMIRKLYECFHGWKNMLSLHYSYESEGSNADLCSKRIYLRKSFQSLIMNAQMASFWTEKDLSQKAEEHLAEVMHRKKYFCFQELLKYSQKKRFSSRMIFIMQQKKIDNIRALFFSQLKNDYFEEQLKQRNSKLFGFFTVWKTKVKEKLMLKKYMNESANLSNNSSISESKRILATIIPGYQSKKGIYKQNNEEDDM